MEIVEFLFLNLIIICVYLLFVEVFLSVIHSSTYPHWQLGWIKYLLVDGSITV